MNNPTAKKYDRSITMLQQVEHQMKGMRLMSTSPTACMHRKDDGSLCDACAEILVEIDAQISDINSSIQHLKIGQLDLTQAPK